jgi:hypothetical protein
MSFTTTPGGGEEVFPASAFTASSKRFANSAFRPFVDSSRFSNSFFKPATVSFEISGTNVVFVSDVAVDSGCRSGGTGPNIGPRFDESAAGDSDCRSGETGPNIGPRFDESELGSSGKERPGGIGPIIGPSACSVSVQVGIDNEFEVAVSTVFRNNGREKIKCAVM